MESQLYRADAQAALNVMSFFSTSAKVICARRSTADFHCKWSYEYKAALKVTVSGPILSTAICSNKMPTSLHFLPLPQALTKALQKCKWGNPWKRDKRLDRLDRLDKLWHVPKVRKTCSAQFHCSAFSHALTAAEKLIRLYKIVKVDMTWRTLKALSHSPAFSQLLINELKLIVSTWIPWVSNMPHLMPSWFFRRFSGSVPRMQPCVYGLGKSNKLLAWRQSPCLSQEEAPEFKLTRLGSQATHLIRPKRSRAVFHCPAFPQELITELQHTTEVNVSSHKNWPFQRRSVASNHCVAFWQALRAEPKWNVLTVFLQACINPNKSIAICQLPANLLRSFVACRGSALNVLTWAICVVPSIALTRPMCVHAPQTCPASASFLAGAVGLRVQQLGHIESRIRAEKGATSGYCAWLCLTNSLRKFFTALGSHRSHIVPMITLISKLFGSCQQGLLNLPKKSGVRNGHPCIQVIMLGYACLILAWFPPFLVKFVSNVCQHASFIWFHPTYPTFL